MESALQLLNPLRESILLTLALAVVIGVYAAKGANQIKTPQVVGYVALGVILGPTVLNLVQDASNFDLVSKLALAVIGFTIGGELRYSSLKQLGRPIAFIVILEALGAFFVVMGGVYLFTQNWPLAIILGALSSATAPAGTVDVLQEYKAKGPLTTTLYAIVGLDDAISLVIFGFALPFAIVLLEPSHAFSFSETLIGPLEEIGVSVAVGAAIGAILAQGLRTVRSSGESLGLTLGAILLCCGIAHVTDAMSLILANMVLGATLQNWKPLYGRRAKAALDGFSPPLFILFFVLVGARIDITSEMLVAIGPVAIVYVLLRTGGKMAGCYVGGSLGKAQRYVKKYVGLGLLSQAGVAIGLAISVNTRLSQMGGEKAELGHTVISIITVTTLLVQVLGPPFLRFALLKTGEGQVAPSKGDS